MDRISIININFEKIPNQDFFYLTKIKKNDLQLLLTRHPPSVILSHEFGHLLFFLQFFKSYNKKELNNISKDFDIYIKEQFIKKFHEVYIRVERKIQKFLPNFKINNYDVLPKEIGSQIANSYFLYIKNVMENIRNIEEDQDKYRRIDDLFDKLLKFKINIKKFSNLINRIVSSNLAQNIIDAGNIVLNVSRVGRSLTLISEAWNRENYEDLLNILPRKINGINELSDGIIFKEVVQKKKPKA